MPASRTALYLCDRVRAAVGTIGTDFNAFERDQLRNGFVGDLGEADLAILPALNEAIQKLLKTGQYKCRFSIGVPAGVAGMVTEINLSPEIGAIEYVKYAGVSLRKVALTSLDARYSGWVNRPLGIPRNYYNDVPDVIGLYPAPLLGDAAGVYSLEILAEALAGDLVLETDVPARLPAQFHEDLVIWAAISLLRSIDGGSEASSRKIADLRRDWDGKDNSQSVIARVQALAQHRAIDETSQLAPFEYRGAHRSGGWY